MDNAVRLAVTKRALEQAARSGDPVPLYGLVRHEESLIQVLTAGGYPAPEGLHQVGEFIRKAGPCLGKFVEFQVGDETFVYCPEHMGLWPDEGEVIDDAEAPEVSA